MHEHYDVIQVGYGPVGQTHAALLAQRGWQVGVFERHPNIYALPRFAHLDHEIVRLFQSLGAAETYMEDARPLEDYVWYNQHGEQLIKFEMSGIGLSGWPSANMNYQPHVEELLDRAVRKTGNVSVNQGWEAVALSQDGDGVELTLRRANSPTQPENAETRVVRGRYLVGADGANSFVRGALGLESDDLGFKEEWLVVDLRPREQVPYGSSQFCDPARPWMRTPLGRRHLRFEFMKMPGDVNEQLASPETVWELLGERGQLTPNDAELIRSTVYQFKSRLLTHWRSGRGLLIGDAAHLMPPFMGQGAASGFRDAANLAWKLDLVLGGRAGINLLDSYQIERSPHVRAYIDLSVHVGKISCTTDPIVAAARDAALMSGEAPPPPAIPGIDQGIIHGGQAAPDDTVTGKLGVQGRIRLDGRTGLADDIIAGHNRWQLISRRSTEAALSDEALAFAKELGLVFLSFDKAQDVDGAYAGYFDSHDVEAILVRPDFYVYGGAKDAVRVSDLLLDLRSRIDWRSASSASA